jgi:hypothetical protein
MSRGGGSEEMFPAADAPAGRIMPSSKFGNPARTIAGVERVPPSGPVDCIPLAGAAEKRMLESRNAGEATKQIFRCQPLREPMTTLKARFLVGPPKGFCIGFFLKRAISKLRCGFAVGRSPNRWFMGLVQSKLYADGSARPKSGYSLRNATRSGDHDLLVMTGPILSQGASQE